MSANTLFLRLEGPMQAWGNHESKFVIRRTNEAPTKSGVIGMLCASMGVSRSKANLEWLPKLNTLEMGVRIDEPGVRWWDYHTVGAGMQMRIAEGPDKTKPGAMLTRREYLCDASFLVALKGEPGLINELEDAMKEPAWTLYLGRKCCPPSRPILEHASDQFTDPLSALKYLPWRPRFRERHLDTKELECLLEWRFSDKEKIAPPDAEVWYDAPKYFEPPAHEPRFVVRKKIRVEVGNQTQCPTPGPLRPRANYRNSEYEKAREIRLDSDHNLCIFCKSRATTVQHVTYRRAGGDETQEDLRSLCRLCHDAVTMIEYGLGMGLDRINPEDKQWRDRIIKKRAEIIEFRSLETRRRRLAEEEVE